jgi:hypothetical protein
MKIIQTAVLPRTEGSYPCVLAVTEDGKLYIKTLSGFDEQPWKEIPGPDADEDPAQTSREAVMRKYETGA